MNVGHARKSMLRQAIQLEGMTNGHPSHDQKLCDYADAAAQDMYEKIV
ncbi:MAG: hypothetical protein Q4C54_09195 [Clostridia bacterium]|nr:hypothetical protein [Clostridia bacterium]